VCVCASQRLVDEFNRDEMIDVLLLTTHVGGLGLNLTGAGCCCWWVGGGVMERQRDTPRERERERERER